MKPIVFSIVFFCSLFAPNVLLGDEIERREYIIKASFILKFPSFMEWPNPINRLKVCIPEDDPNIGIWESLEKENNFITPFALMVFNDLSDYRECNVLFFSGKNDPMVEKLVSLTKGKPILIISDSVGYLEKGVGINFLTRNNRVRFEINRNSIIENNLIISSELLSLAFRVIE